MQAYFSAGPFESEPELIPPTRDTDHACERRGRDGRVLPVESPVEAAEVGHGVGDQDRRDGGSQRKAGRRV